MELQPNKPKNSLDQKEEIDKRKRNFSKKAPIRVFKETQEDNDVIIINNVQDLEKDIKNYIEKMEKQIIINNSVLSMQRNHFKDIISKLSLYLDQRGINFESMQKYFKTLDFSSFLNPKIKKITKDYTINDLKSFFSKFEDLQAKDFPISSEIIEENNVVLIESDPSLKNEVQEIKEEVKIEKPTMKRSRGSGNNDPAQKKKEKGEKFKKNQSKYY